LKLSTAAAAAAASGNGFYNCTGRLKSRDTVLKAEDMNAIILDFSFTLKK
jgi:hypothetical protein